MGQKKQSGYSLPKGVRVRENKTGGTLIITFTYKGVLCREPLSRLSVDNKNIRYAERLLGEIQNNIEKNTFNYAQYFPSSKKVPLFGIGNREKRVIDYLNEYINICEVRSLSPSTIVGYRKYKVALSDLHNLNVSALTPAVIKNWIQKQNTSLKTVRNRLSFLRSALDEAITDGLIKLNPASLVTASRYQSSASTTEGSYIVDPLSPAEVSALLQATSSKQHENLFRFAINTGMRSSELCSLKWSSLDFINKTVHVLSASVVGIIKETKTKAGMRKIELNDEAVKALLEQKPFTFMKNDVVFEDPKTDQAWAGADAIRKKAWVPTLRKAGIRYRNPYQTRHTFATSHISRGANLFWLAGQMGHKGPEMLFRYYGSYLKEYDGKTDNQSSAVHQ